MSAPVDVLALLDRRARLIRDQWVGYPGELDDVRQAHRIVAELIEAAKAIAAAFDGDTECTEILDMLSKQSRFRNALRALSPEAGK